MDCKPDYRKELERIPQQSRETRYERTVRFWPTHTGVPALQPPAGTRLDSFESGKAVLTLPVRKELKQQHGFVHGGVVSYLADNALTYAGGSVLGDSVTSEYKINYLRPALGDTLIARASVLSAGRKQAVCQCEVVALHQDEERMVAFAQGTINRVGARE
ncbi:MAG: PaaI family thioesterase [Marinobacter sp.]|uniref:PaaI family thioesterase n=1 Tax=Marinobacter sp. TaxID=50741 RepID=UPI00299D5BF5|nr:PaaI family thioesterase [Marinobacter sp.]MDX1755692.1 PaaI family thioesterase [Marinobacter sp.]